MLGYSSFFFIKALFLLYFVVGEDDGEIKRLSLINDDLSIDDFYRTWRDCSNYRISQILNAENSNEILDSWPAYKSNRAQKLVSHIIH